MLLFGPVLNWHAARRDIQQQIQVQVQNPEGLPVKTEVLKFWVDPRVRVLRSDSAAAKGCTTPGSMCNYCSKEPKIQ
jgi:hypothetical protein